MPNKPRNKRRLRLHAGESQAPETARRNAEGKSVLKKSSGIFREGNRLVVYRFILDNHRVFGLRWLLRRFSLSPNAYYNFLKCRKSGYHVQKQQVLDTIQKIYHETEGKLGHRSMKIFLSRKNIFLSKTTVHKYMNKELRLTSIVKRKKPEYVKGHAHKVFPNLLNQNFTTDKVNRVWCTDFTYLFLSDGRKR